MHPKVEERRKAVLMDALERLSPEDEGRALADFVKFHEGKLPRPENYRKKTLPRLRILFRTIGENIEIVSKPGWGETGKALSEMYRRHRAHVVKELARRGRI